MFSSIIKPPRCALTYIIWTPKDLLQLYKPCRSHDSEWWWISDISSRRSSCSTSYALSKILGRECSALEPRLATQNLLVQGSCVAHAVLVRSKMLCEDVYEKLGLLGPIVFQNEQRLIHFYKLASILGSDWLKISLLLVWFDQISTVNTKAFHKRALVLARA